MTLTPSTIGRLIIYVRKLLVARCRSLVKVGCYAHLRGPPRIDRRQTVRSTGYPARGAGPGWGILRRRPLQCLLNAARHHRRLYRAGRGHLRPGQLQGALVPRDGHAAAAAGGMTPRTQSDPPDERQVANSAGGYAYLVDDRNRLDRFLILGSKELRAIFHWITQGTLHEESESLGCLAIIRAFEQAKTATPYDAAALVRRHKMTWEMMPAKLVRE